MSDGFVVRVLLLAGYVGISVAALLAAGEEWPTVMVGVCGVGVAIWFGYWQQRLGDEMRRLSEVTRLLQFAPVLSVTFSKADDEIGAFVELNNIGRGPAMELRGGVFTRSSSSDGVMQKLSATPNVDHLGPDDDFARVFVDDWGTTRKGLLGKEYRGIDVWIVHCGDQNGCQWHAWSNWSRANQRLPSGEYSPSGQFFFERLERTPPAIIDHCDRCWELARQYPERYARHVGRSKNTPPLPPPLTA